MGQQTIYFYQRHTTQISGREEKRKSTVEIIHMVSKCLQRLIRSCKNLQPCPLGSEIQEKMKMETPQEKSLKAEHFTILWSPKAEKLPLLNPLLTRWKHGTEMRMLWWL